MQEIQTYSDTIKTLKATILSSRYRAALLVNKEVLSLYFFVGKMITEKTKQEKWGSHVLDNLSQDLQAELPGLRGFSATNIKRMKLFYESWATYFQIRPSISDELQKVNFSISPTVTDKIQTAEKQEGAINPPVTNELSIIDDTISSAISNELQKLFLQVSFSHHYEILLKTSKLEERIFYIQKIAINFWSVDTLKHHLKAKLFEKEGALPNNFTQTLSNNDLRAKALLSFKDEYLLDFINIEDPDEENERLIENEIVRNIRKFLLSLGTDFAFIGNQHRLIVEDEEYFIDLLFFNRKLQCLVAFELKKGKFKPEYMGKMNFYLTALDELVKQPHENTSIGIILCKEKNNKIVEFSFRDFNKTMGVATYKTANELPEQYKDALPTAETLKKLMD